MKKRHILLLMTAMLITLGGCSKETENNTAFDKDVESEQSTEDGEQSNGDEEQSDASEEEEAVIFQSISGYELSGMMDDVAHILGRNCVNWYEETVTPLMVQRAAEDEEEVKFTNTEQGNWNFEEIVKDMRLQLMYEGYADSFNVSTGCVATNFNEPYRYEPGSAEDLYTLTEISFSATDDEYGTESTKDIYAIVQYSLTGEDWRISDIQYIDENDLYITAKYYGCKDYSKYDDFFFNRDFNTDNSSIVYDTNIKGLVAGLDTSDMNTCQTLFNQLYENEINDEDFDSDYSYVKCSVEYIDDDDIPELILWWYEKESENFCWQAKIYHYSGKCLHVRTFHVANGLVENATYTPKQAGGSAHLLVKEMDTDIETTWKEYVFYADTVHAQPDTQILKQRPQDNSYQYTIIGEPADSAEEVQEHISSLGMNTAFSIYDSVDEAFKNLK